VIFWTTPNAGGQDVHAGYPFDLSGLSTAGFSFPTFPNPSFEASAGCAAGDGLANPTGYCTEWANGNVTSYQIGQSAAAARDGAQGLLLQFGQCATSPCGGSQFPGIFALSDKAGGVSVGDWAVVRFWGRYSGGDHAASVTIIDNATDHLDSVKLVKETAFSEYVLIGKSKTVDLTLRAAVHAPTDNNTTTHLDLLH
jgi:hypothetical protein